MTRAEIERLLALYSAGRISAADREALYAAAIDDPALFEELFEEDALREALADPQVRAAALAAQPGGVDRPERTSISRWTWWRWPAFAAIAAAALLAIVVVRRSAPDAQVQMAQHRAPEAQMTPVPMPAPPPPDSASAAKEESHALVVERPKAERLRDSQSADPAARPAAPRIVQHDRLTQIPEAKPLAAPPQEIATADTARVPTAPAPAAAREMQAALPAPPPESQARFARDSAEAVVLAPTEPAAMNMTARNAAQPAVMAALAARDGDGVWRDIAAGSVVSQETPLRLTIRTARAGTLVISPDFTPPVAMKAGETKTFDLPRQDQGAHLLRIALRESGESAKAKAFQSTSGAMSAAPGVAGAAPREAARAATAQPVEIRFEVR